MPISISQLLRLSIATIKRDPIILAPYLFFFVVTQLVMPFFDLPTSFEFQKWTTSMTLVFLSQWIFELFFKLGTISLAKATFLSPTHRISLKQALKSVLIHYIPTLIWSALLLSPLVLAFIFGTPFLGQYGISPQIFWFFLGVLLLPVGLCVEFLPTVLICGVGSWRSAAWTSLQFIKRNLRAVLIFMALSVTILMGSVLVASVLALAPGSIGVLLSNLAQGVGYGVIYTINPILFLANLQRD